MRRQRPKKYLLNVDRNSENKKQAIDCENICKTHLIKDWYSKYIRNSPKVNYQRTKEDQIFEWAKDLKRQVTKEEIQMAKLGT